MADVWFLGVKTAGSLIHRALPLWQPLLPEPFGVRGVDVEPGAPDTRYVEVLEELRRDEGAVGAVVSVHKVGLFRAGRDLFSHLEPAALACEEVNAVRRTASGLRGYARDPLSVGRVVDRIWPGREGDVVCLGAGGTARALAYHLRRAGEGVRFVCADPSSDALGQLAGLAGASVVTHVGRGPWDELVATAAPGSLIVNATGMGKDRPGSPITDRATFPRGAVAWELNYRGGLGFLRQARVRVQARQLEVHDGWLLFCHGWAAALGAVLGMADDPELGERFAEAARSVRP